MCRGANTTIVGFSSYVPPFRVSVRIPQVYDIFQGVERMGATPPEAGQRTDKEGLPMARTDRQTVERPWGTRKPEYKPVYTDTPPSSITESTLTRRDTGGGQSTREGGRVQHQDKWKRSEYLLRKISLDLLSRMDCTFYARTYWDLVQERYQCPKDDSIPGTETWATRGMEGHRGHEERDAEPVGLACTARPEVENLPLKPKALLHSYSC